MVYFVCVMAASLVRLRWKALVGLVGITVIAGIVIAAGGSGWIGGRWRGSSIMSGKGGELVVLVGAYGAAVLWGGGRAVLGGYAWVRRRRVSERTFTERKATMITAGFRAIADRIRRLNRGIRRRRMGIGYALGGAVVTLIVIAGWRFYAGWRTGRVELTTEGDPVVVQVLAEDSDTPIGEPFDLAARAVVELPEGDYRLRVNGKGRLGRTFRFEINRGETHRRTISIDDGRLLGGDAVKWASSGDRYREVRIPFPPVIAALELEPGKTSFVEWTEGSLICRDGETGNVVWDALSPGAGRSSEDGIRRRP